MDVPCKFETTAFPTRKPKEVNQTFVDHHVNPKDQQVHMTDQVMLPPLWNSFVGTGIHNGPVPPANEGKIYLNRFQILMVANVKYSSSEIHAPEIKDQILEVAGMD